MVVSAGGVDFGIGGAITALSDPAEEFAEIIVKAASSRSVLADQVVAGGSAGDLFDK